MTTTRTDAPGRVIPILQQEFEDFRTEATAFLEGKTEEAIFIGFRLKQGVYGQRQPARQMIRVKLPFGAVSADQLDAFGRVAEEYAPLRKGHITTRQNYQFHHIPLERMTEVLEYLGTVGLSSREACGNTVRNVTGDPYAGVRPDEPFDISPYAGAFVRYFVRQNLTQLLPRKCKVAFTGSAQDEAITDIHDIGFIPEIRDVDGVPTKGFKMVAGGGLAIMARHAVTIREWVSVDDYLRVSEAVIRIFNAADELRKNRAKARLKFLVHRVGEAEFNRMVDDELMKPWADQRISPEDLLFLDDEEADAPPHPENPKQPGADRAEFERFWTTNVRKQRQAGYCTIDVTVPQGDMSPEQFRGVASILRTYGNGRARTSVNQNIVLRWIPEGSVYAVWTELQALGLAKGGSGEITDVVSCPGTDSCKLGITCSMGLNRAISSKLYEMNIEDPTTRKMRINMSGCPNSCGQHHLASIGFHGAAIKASNDADRQVPAYHIFMGGARGDGHIRIGQLLKARIPAKRAPVVVERFIRYYEAERQSPDEEFNAFFDRVGPAPFDALLGDLTIPPEFSLDNMGEFIDWERDGLYVLERGEGECAI
ncbi:MAG TPA: nitrite/sulfite reductase [Dehalococcoidia bacterium]|nr:nitrite/sulfite reductase [Dehalococcoidia bacterium]